MKHVVGSLGIVLISLSTLGCGASTPEMAPRAAHTPPSAVAQGSGALPLDTDTLARERLVLLRQEMLRVATRLEHEGTADQRALWHQELNDIAHDCTELATQWRDAEHMPQLDRAAEHARLVPLIDVLYAVNARTAAQIDHSLDGIGGSAATRRWGGSP
jgi:hypothetical protein